MKVFLHCPWQRQRSQSEGGGLRVGDAMRPSDLSPCVTDTSALWSENLRLCEQTHHWIFGCIGSPWVPSSRLSLAFT